MSDGIAGYRWYRTVIRWQCTCLPVGSNLLMIDVVVGYCCCESVCVDDNMKSLVLPRVKSVVSRFFKKQFASRTHDLIGLKSGNQLTSLSVRQTFVDFFVQHHAHSFVESSSVIPKDDPSLLFVNAGMNQFKPIFLNRLPPEDVRLKLKRVVNSQKCIRVGGKHCDLDNVGRDLRHHTFFEMLGNWSFGDYHKKEACHMAWTLLTDVYKLNSDNLFVTYFGGSDNLPADNETKEIWQNIGLSAHKIIPLGTGDNFWEMGFFGPCGVCTEIHYFDGDDAIEKATLEKLLQYSVEIWNIVFIQYNKTEDGHLHGLSNHFVDTGMGLERILALLQGAASTYETDLFLPLFDEIHNISNVRPYSGSMDDPIDIGYRILADHSRMFTVAISDGLLPKWEKAGYILRKVIRRSAVIAYEEFKVKSATELLCRLAEVVVKSLGDFYPEIKNNSNQVKKVITDEVNLFEQNIERRRREEKEAIEKENARRRYEEELNAFIELLQREFEQVDLNVPFVVHTIKNRGDMKLMFKVALDHFGHKPAAVFYISDEENQFYFQLSVPKCFTNNLSALEWYNAILLQQKELLSRKRLKKMVFAKSDCLKQLDDFIKMTCEVGTKHFSLDIKNN